MTTTWSPSTATGRGRFVRIDGAVVKWDDSSPYPNPVNPGARMWTAWEPDPSQRYLRRESKRGVGWPRRWKTAKAAMRAVDREYPLQRFSLTPDSDFGKVDA